MNENRDFFAEGADAAIAGRSDIAPEDVMAAGLEAEASWNDSYNSVTEEEEAEAGGAA